MGTGSAVLDVVYEPRFFASDSVADDSDICSLDRSLSFALSRAARGAVGKYWAKLLKEARDMVWSADYRPSSPAANHHI